MLPPVVAVHIQGEEFIMSMAEVFSHERYLIRRKVFKLFGAAFHIYDGVGGLVGYCKQKAFKLKEDIRIYTDETCQTELLGIMARNVIDFSASYDVVDPQAGEAVGTLQRRGFKSMFRDEWVLCNVAGEQIGTVKEDSWFMALVRRYVLNIFPQVFTASIGEMPVANYRQNFNPFVNKLDVQLEPDALTHADPRLLLAAGILLGAIEGRQKSQ